jgi:integrase
MDEAPKVWVVDMGARATFVLQWRDPTTQRIRMKATKIPRSGLARDRKAAERLAGELESQLAAGSAALPSKFTWEDFRKRYDAEVLPGLAKFTEAKVKSVFDRLETEISPARLRDLTEARISHFAAALRKSGVAETTIQGYLAHLKAAMNWAVRQKLLPALPAFPKVQRAKKSNRRPMKGRPITAEEFERMLATVPKVVGERLAPEWQRYLRGLWVSGLRLAESLDLWWDREDRLLPVFPRGGRPMLKVPAELEKGHADRLLPIAPEFAMFLMETPPERREGPVFPLLPRKGNHGRPLPRAVSAIVSKIGAKAGVKVHVDPKDPDRVKYASAHDLRRAFGERWAARVMPPQLMELMRHESIDTTLRYYVGTDAQRTADAAWAAFERAGGAFSAPAPSAAPSAEDLTPSDRGRRGVAKG